MADVLKIRAELGLACFRFTGAIRIPDVRDAFVDWATRPEFNPDYVMLFDAVAVTSVDATFLGILAEVQALRAHLQRFEPGGGLVVAVVSAETVFGMARILEQVLDYTTRIRMVTVRDPAEAMRLAGVAGRDLEGLHTDPPK